eukprot:CAMPEP_0181131908 /NCGR_PEP_ID=MMETSP1071-20121207/30709_1 /TAXON_ID=35127 /ORGANISM="Thalassiosira sp., Strain NH16" /LENGTH=903 /DNA_ID=CAMNT_0023218199 /DNA_START=288 /DNA_END=2999 /DNA_ORIENTATION=-
MESRAQGFQNGIRAILRVSDSQSIPPDKDVRDPQSVEAKHGDAKILNCHTHGCIPITELSPLRINNAKVKEMESEIHHVNTYYQPAPQYSHFVSIDSSAVVQNELQPAAMISQTFRPSKSMHQHSMALRVSHSSAVIIVWRTTLLMDVPMHLHGHTVEILDIAYPVLHSDCNLQSCELSRAFDSTKKVKALDKTPPNQAVKKDTFVIPAGGAVVTRMHTGSQGLWMVNGQKDVHNEDGISFVLVVGNYRIPLEDDWPSDFPTCNSTLVKSMSPKPHCECYIDKDAPLDLMPGRPKFCSRPHLCRHELSQDLNVYDKGFKIQSTWIRIPDIIVSVIFIFVLVASTALVIAIPLMRRSCLNNEPKSNRRLSSLDTGSKIPQRRRSSINDNISSRCESPSILGLSVVASNRESHISTVKEIHEEEDEDDSVFGPQLPHKRVFRRLSSLGIGSKIPQRRRSNIDINISSRCESPSILGLSVVASNRESHIGTVNEIHEEEDEDDSYFGETDDEHEPARLHPPLPSRRRSSGLSTGDLLRNKSLVLSRRSTVSTFERIFRERGEDDGDIENELKDAFVFLLDGYSVKGKVEITPMDDEVANRGSSFMRQLLYIFSTQWHAYFQTSTNLLRFIEVAGLALITGLVFRSAGSGTSQATVRELSSLVLVLTTMWTFSRLFSAIPSYSDWFKSIQVVFRHRRFSLLPVFIARTAVVILCEGMFPMISVFICFTVAGLVGDTRSLCNISFLLASNNMCYLSLGAVLGMFTSVPRGMIAATIFSQVSILAAGIFTELPESSRWLRSLSPFYWTVRGLLKSILTWTDTYDCVNGSSSDIGANQCFIEYDPLIEQYKRRGLQVAAYNDPMSDSVLTESIALAALCLGLHAIIFGRCFFTYYKVNWDATHRRGDSLR